MTELSNERLAEILSAMQGPVGAVVLRGQDLLDVKSALQTLRQSRMSELPDEIRIPLHSLQADVDYLFGRVVADASTVGAMAESVKHRLAQIEAALTPASAEGEAKRWLVEETLKHGSVKWAVFEHEHDARDYASFANDTAHVTPLYTRPSTPTEGMVEAKMRVVVDWADKQQRKPFGIAMAIDEIKAAQEPGDA